MSDAFQLGSVVQSVLDGPKMTISNPGPLKATPVGVGSRVVSGPAPSPDLIICKWFVGAELQSKRVKIGELKLVNGPLGHEIELNDIVELASGGPRMLVTRVGPKATSVGVSVVGGRLRQYGGNVRNDLVGCKWHKGNSDVSDEFEVGTLRLIEKR